MTATVRQFLDSYDALPDEDKHRAAVEILRRCSALAGGNLPDDQQSVHFGMTFRHPDRTLTGEEVERAVRAVVEACGQRFKARIRG